MQITVGGVKLNASVEGRDGAPWVTLVTGIANDLTMWDGQIPVLAGDLKILRYDFRGHGGSQSTPPPYAMETLRSDLVGLWDHLGIARTHLVGLGLGGAMILGAAAQHSDRIDRLVPCCCRAKMVPDFAQMWQGLIAQVKAEGVGSIVERTAQRWFSDDFKANNPQMLDGVRAMIRGTSLDGYLGCVGAFLTLDHEADLPRIKAPTLFVSGGEDKMGGPPALMQGLAERVPGARHVSIPDAAHIANLQNEAGFNGVLSRFLIQGTV